MDPRISRRYLAAAALVVSSLAAPATSLVAQYPLAPSPVLTLDDLTSDIELSGYVSVRETVRQDTATFMLNRARVTVQVRPLPWAAVRLQGDFAAIGRARSDTVPAFSLTDAYVQLGPPDSAVGPAAWLRPALLVGQLKSPFSLEYLTSFTALLTADRSEAVDRLAPRRDIGALASLSAGRWASVWAAVTNGEGANATDNPDARQMAVARLGLFPVPSLAIAGKWAGQGSDRRWGFDARWRGRHVVAEGELLRRSGPAGSGPAGSEQVDGRGGYALVAVRTSDWLQPVVKWERLRETTTALVTTRRSHTAVTYGLNLVAPGERLRLQLDYVDRWASSDDTIDELIAQLQAIF